MPSGRTTRGGSSLFLDCSSSINRYTNQKKEEQSFNETINLFLDEIRLNDRAFHSA